MTEPVTPGDRPDLLPGDPLSGAPPPDAPREVTQPLDPSARAVPEHLRGMEKALAPLTYPDSAGAPVPVVPVPVVPMPPVVPPTAPAAATVVTPVATVVTPVATVAPAESYQPAASNTESPSRGVPTPARDPSLQPTGGFGRMPGADYNPLDGTEVRELVLRLFDQIAGQLQHDLRFVRALTYPRLECRVTVDVVTFPPEGAARITKILPDPKRQMPRDVALLHADECCFVVSAQRQEVNAAGESIDPPDKLRDELELPKPHLQVVGEGVARQIVDIVPAAVPDREYDVNGHPLSMAIDPPRHSVAGAGGVPRPDPSAPVVPRSLGGPE